MKQAANFKIDRMIRNACAVHRAADEEQGSSRRNETSYGRALLSYSKTANDTEELGAIFLMIFVHIVLCSLPATNNICFADIFIFYIQCVYFCEHSCAYQGGYLW